MRRRRQIPSRSLQAPSRSTSSQKLFNTSRSAHPDTCFSSPPSKAVPPSFSASHSLPTRSCPTSRYCVCSAAQPAQRTPCPFSATAVNPWSECRRYRAVVGMRPAPRALAKRTGHQHRLPATSRHQVVDQRREAGIAAERHTCGHPRSTVCATHPIRHRRTRPNAAQAANQVQFLLKPNSPRDRRTRFQCDSRSMTISSAIRAERFSSSENRKCSRQ